MRQLPTYAAILEKFPTNASQRAFVTSSRTQIESIIKREDSRLLLIVGPCSIHDLTSAKEFALKLAQISKEISDRFYVCMRVYCEKPRTISGWKGLIYDPHLDGSNNIQAGIEWTRQLMLELTDFQIPIATEFLDPLTAFYYDDLVSWGSIGARTSSSQIHRQLASALQLPIGFKNGIAGNITAAIEGMIASKNPHSFIGLNPHGLPSLIFSLGNAITHIVLRGGEAGPNFSSHDLAATHLQLKHHHLLESILIDCSHHNCNKNHLEQSLVFESVIQQVKLGNSAICGMMLESHLFAGKQNHALEQLKYGVSITDACLDWKSTLELIKWGYHFLNESHFAERGANAHCS